VRKYGLRIAVDIIEDGFADVSIYTYDGGCAIAAPEFLYVGEAIVMTDRPEGGGGYEIGTASNWTRPTRKSNRSPLLGRWEQDGHRSA
jgi:hypothetical protein